jgi:hypothetical protein
LDSVHGCLSCCSASGHAHVVCGAFVAHERAAAFPSFSQNFVHLLWVVAYNLGNAAWICCTGDSGEGGRKGSRWTVWRYSCGVDRRCAADGIITCVISPQFTEVQGGQPCLLLCGSVGAAQGERGKKGEVSAMLRTAAMEPGTRSSTFHRGMDSVGACVLLACIPTTATPLFSTRCMTLCIKMALQRSSASDELGQIVEDRSVWRLATDLASPPAALTLAAGPPLPPLPTLAPPLPTLAPATSAAASRDDCGGCGTSGITPGPFPPLQKPFARPLSLLMIWIWVATQIQKLGCALLGSLQVNPGLALVAQRDGWPMPCTGAASKVSKRLSRTQPQSPVLNARISTSRRLLEQKTGF